MELLECEKHQDTFIASPDMLLITLQTLLKEPSTIEIWKIQKCDAGGWHIFWEGKKGEEKK